MSINEKTLNNTTNTTRKVVGEILLRPDFDDEFSSVITTNDGGPYSDLDGIGPSAIGDSYGAFNKNGQEFYQPQMGSFFIDCSLVTPGGNPCNIYNPALIQVPLVEGGFGRFASSSFTPNQFGVTGTVPTQQSYKEVFNKPNPLRFKNNSIELTYTILHNDRNRYADVRRMQKHKTLISTWTPYGMDNLTTDNEGNIVLENDLNITHHSTITRTYDANGADGNDNDYQFGGQSEEFYHDPYYDGSTITYGDASFSNNPSILDAEILGGGYSTPGVGNNFFNPVYNPDYFFAPRVRVSSGFNPSPRYLQLTPIFEFFVVAPHIFVKGHYRIY